jgi:anthranilate phosphoribosyltransferase
VPILAGALAELGSIHSMVVHGEPGLDEISPLGQTSVVEIRNGVAEEWVLDPGAFGLAGGDESDLAGGSPEDNARIITETLSGGGTAAGRAAVILNAAAAVYLSGIAASFGDGVDAAREALDRGLGIAALDRLRQAYSAAA